MSRLGAGFSAAVVAYRFPHMLLFDRKVAGAMHHRDAAHVRRDGLDHFTLQVLRSGRMLAGRAGEERAMRPGDVAVYGTTRPQRTVVERAHYIALTLPRDVVESVLPTARDLHGTILPRAAAGLLGDFIGSLVRNASTMGPASAARGGAMVAELLAGVAGDAAPRRSDDEHTLALQRARGEAYIDAHLHDRDLDVNRVAAALGLSRATLYRAFAPVDGVARQILRRRLKRLQAALAAPGELRSVAALGFDLGFASESHCSRAFKSAFGVTPGQFRAAARHAGPFEDSAARTGDLIDWYRDLA
ncbi:helix-turn-helix domain-containing protein [Lichenibacterium dinghuense]|uniref:helix-turn-helix domain-containing protein n=1 Tax=Lichenibacterium dinghuense TaxID=2895977 RepID=UPI001F02F34A|nr:helix-turn-helix domain-containing protein [Lichenibacterium sp. 6Y81]